MSIVRAVWSAVTWRKFLIMLALGFSLPVLRAAWGERPVYASSSLVIVLCATVNLLVALTGDEVAKRGARLQRVYSSAIFGVLLVNCVIAAIADWCFGGRIASPEAQPFAQWPGMLLVGIDSSLWGVFALFVYLNRGIAERMLQGVREAELRRVRLEGQLIESRLAAAQAQVDPAELFAALAEVHNELRAAAPDADEKLDRLIQKLRASMARTVTPGDLEAARP